MADVIVSQQVTAEEIVDEYNHAGNIQAIAAKHGLPVETVNSIVNKAFPQDVDGEDVVIPVVVEGENPQGEVASTKNQKA